MRRRSVLGVAAVAVALFAGAVLSPVAEARPSPVLPVPHRTIAALNQSDSLNWSGHSQGALDHGSLFNQVSGEWIVPTAKQHAGGAEFSSTWVGIGGGCLDSSCTGTDTTLIQAGTEQVVDRSGATSYAAWYELIPAPAILIDTVAVAPGDRIFVDIYQVIPGLPLWTIELENRSNGQSWSTTVPYLSTQGSANWIVETPIVISTGGSGLASMPDLTPTRFDNAKRNGQRAKLSTADQIRLVSSSGSDIIAVPSSADAERDGFHVCTYAESCPAPGSV